jgi:hypothetical protein
MNCVRLIASFVPLRGNYHRREGSEAHGANCTFGPFEIPMPFARPTMQNIYVGIYP